MTFSITSVQHVLSHSALNLSALESIFIQLNNNTLCFLKFCVNVYLPETLVAKEL